ncbi:MAG: protein kinase [Acidobacteriia bacterium]|nr:protein kinase [Terriglobia bacterium]
MTGQSILHYDVAEKLGEGGMGVVYKALDRRLDRAVAIKILPSEVAANAQRKRRFMNEARAASALSHPNIVTIYDIASERGADYLVMEYIDGPTLAGVLEAGPLKPSRALHYAVQMADALAKAHGAGIVHRDLKPANVMLTADDVVKIMDFGLAKLAEPASGSNDGKTLTFATEAGLVMGTLNYMSPEQAEGRTVDARSDIFSFGAVLYEMLTGRRAFSGMLRREPAPVTGLSPEVPGALEQIVTRALRAEPERRFQSMADLKAALEQVREAISSGAVAQPACEAPSIAVLPFANLSPDPDNEYFSDGLAEEIINALTRIPGLRVIARTSAFSFKGEKRDLRAIGERLRVNTVLDGSVRKAGSRVRVSAQLIDVADESHLWSERYDRELNDIFAIQDDIAEAIVEGLKLRFSPCIANRAQRPVNIEAYNLCLRGVYLTSKLTPEGLGQGRECYERALAIDPGCALAYQGLSSYYCNFAVFGLGPPREALLTARGMAQKALELDESLAEAHSCLGSVLGFLDLDWPGAEREFRRAIELNPQATAPRWYYASNYLRVMGRLEEATVEMQRVVEMDPLSVLHTVNLGWMFYERRLFGLAIEQYRKAIELDPTHYMPHWMLAGAYFVQNKMDECLACVEKAVMLSSRVPWSLGYLGLTYAKLGRRDEVRAILDELSARRQTGFVTPMSFALCHIGLGEFDQAFRYLQQGLDERDPTLFWLREPTLASIQSDPRFRALLRQLKLDA